MSITPGTHSIAWERSYDYGDHNTLDLSIETISEITDTNKISDMIFSKDAYMELDLTCTHKGYKQWLHGSDGVAAWRKKKSGTAKDHMKKDSGKEMQTGGVDHLLQSLFKLIKQQ